MTRFLGLAIGLSASLGACATTGGAEMTRLGTAALHDANGRLAGQAELSRTGDRLRLSVAAFALPPGEHGFHLHMTGRCEAPGFSSAGLHLNPSAHQHGSANPAGSHLGDLPNLVADSGGKGSFVTDLNGAGAELTGQIFDTDGTAIVIHAAPDDYRTDPTGNSGARIACGVFVKP